MDLFDKVMSLLFIYYFIFLENITKNILFIFLLKKKADAKKYPSTNT